MYKKITDFIQYFGVARLIILGFFLFLCVMAVALNLDFAELFSSSLVRIGMNGVLVLAMLPAISSGIGPNFGVSLGILAGLIGALMAIELRLDGYVAFFGAIGFALPFAALVGLGYGWLLNRVKGSEMMLATFVGFSAVSVMKIAWLILPFNNPEMAWPIGRGVRVTIALDNRQLAQLLNKTLAFEIGNVVIPTGLLAFFLLCCALMWVFMRTKTGVAMRAAGDNPRFATAAGINVDRHRIIGTVVSTILGAIGILVFAQSYGFLQLYEGPMFMPFVAVAAILIGGASIKKASIAHVIIGTFLFQATLVVAMPVANAFTADMASMAEISRIIIQNGIILYALTQTRGE
ncbi:MAG: ABC transporter permease [Chloroflexi bacterium]|nr:ABC transporter permease [Chloroflexota bacterium]